MRAKFVVAALSVIFGVSMLLPTAYAKYEQEVPLPVSKSEAMKLKIPADIANGARVFNGCNGCHDAGPTGVNNVGPMLTGVVGRPAGSLVGYDYSNTLMSAGKGGLVWTPYKLDAFLMAPSLFLAGNKMPYVGVKDETERRDLIGYLKTLQ